MADTNPYTQTITDEASGTEVKNNDYYVWDDGYKAGQKRESERIFDWLEELLFEHRYEDSIPKQDIVKGMQILKAGK